MKKKKIILIGAATAAVGLIAYNIFFKNGKTDFTLFEVVRGNVVQEISETGQIQMGKAINLGFKNSGTVQNIFIKVGDKVWPGSYLIAVDSNQLLIEKAEAQATLGIARAKLDNLMAGATAEEIQAAQTDVANAKTSLDDTQEQYEEDLKQSYDDALNALDGAYLKASSALNTVSSLRKTYFSGGDQESTTVRTKETNISSWTISMMTAIAQAKATSTNSITDSALTSIKMYLNNIYDALNIIRDTTETINYTGIVSAADKTSLNTERTNINTASTNIVNAQQVISSAKIGGQASINAAQGNLEKTQDDLALKLAKPTQANIDLYQAQVNQAKAQVDLLDNKISDSILKSPVRGQITKINKRVGETVQSALSESVIVMLPENPYEIEVNIYEEDIVKMSLGNEVNISLIAFPDQIFKGRVIAIDPAEELIDSVVYYKITINLEQTPEGIKPGMTADLAIRVASRENVLIIPANAIQEKDGKKTAKVSQNNKIEERIIETGLVGSDDNVEIITGLTEGEKVVID